WGCHPRPRLGSARARTLDRAEIAAMVGFRDAAAFTPPTDLQLLPLRFQRLRPDRYLVNNFVGDGLLLTRHELDRIVSLDLIPGDGLYERACEKLLVSAKGKQSPLQLLAMRLRSRM